MGSIVPTVFRPLAALFVLVTFGIVAVAWRPSPSQAAAAAVVTDLRVGLQNGATRVVLDVSDRVEFQVFHLADPYRVVIDLPEVGWRLPAKPLPAAVGAFERVRYGLYKPGTSRVVIDLTQPAVVDQAFALDRGDGHGYRLVVDLAPLSREAFLAAVGPPRQAPIAARAIPFAAAGTAAMADTSARVATAAPAMARSAFPLPPRKPETVPKRRVVAIDPGHGGADPGTVGISGVYEKNVTLSIAREMAQVLEATGRYRVVLTRDRDVFVPLRVRFAVARAAGAELFVSIHADAIADKSMRGMSVYTLSEKASDREAELLAEKENKADLIAGVDLREKTPEVTNILIDLAQRETMNQSARLAGHMVREMGQETPLLRNTHRFAGFVVLKAPDVPSVLLEVGFLSNSQDEAALRRRGHRLRLAQALVRAFDGYFDRIEQASRP